MIENGQETFEATDIHTLEQLIDGMACLLSSYQAIGGEYSLNDYGRGQYDLAFRIMRKLEKIQASQKASEDA